MSSVPNAMNLCLTTARALVSVAVWAGLAAGCDGGNIAQRGPDDGTDAQVPGKGGAGGGTADGASATGGAVGTGGITGAGGSGSGGYFLHVRATTVSQDIDYADLSGGRIEPATSFERPPASGEPRHMRHTVCRRRCARSRFAPSAA